MNFCRRFKSAEWTFPPLSNGELHFQFKGCWVELYIFIQISTPFILDTFNRVHWQTGSTYGPRLEKTCLQGFRKSDFQTSLLSYTDWLENCNFTCSRFTYRILSIKRITKALIRLRGCAGWSASVLFANSRRQVFSRGPYDKIKPIYRDRNTSFYRNFDRQSP